MSRLVLRGARWPGEVAIDDGVITEVGTATAVAGDEVLDCNGGIITAGLVNTHHHLFQWMTRGRAIGCDLFGWLTTLYPIWGRLEVDDVHAAARVGMSELALSGCTSVFDHHYLVPRGDDTVFDAIVAAAHEVGVRLFMSRGSMDLSEKDGGLPPDHVVEDLEAILASTESVIARHHDGEMVTVVVAPCSPFSVSPELMQASAELARRHGLRMHTHLAETLEEQEDCLARFGKRPTELLDSWGWIAPDVWVAHGIHFDDAEVERLACDRHRRRPLPVVERTAGRRDVPGHRPDGRGQSGRARSRRRGVERSGPALRRDAPGALHRPPAHARGRHVHARECARARDDRRRPLRRPRRPREADARIARRSGSVPGR